MEMNQNLNQMACLSSYKLAKLLQAYEREKLMLASQLEELKVQLQNAKISNQQEKDGEFAAKMEEQTAAVQCLHAHKTLQNTRRDHHALQQQVHQTNPKVASVRQNSRKLLSQQLNKVVKELNKNRKQFKRFVDSRAQTEQHLQDILKTLKEFEYLKVVCEIEKEKNAALQQELDQIRKHLKQESRFHAERALADLFVIKELKAAMDRTGLVQDRLNNITERRPLLGAAEDGRTQSLGQETTKPTEQSVVSEQEVNPQISGLLRESGEEDKHPSTKTKTVTMLKRFLGLKKGKKPLSPAERAPPTQKKTQ